MKSIVIATAAISLLQKAPCVSCRSKSKNPNSNLQMMKELFIGSESTEKFM